MSRRELSMVKAAYIIILLLILLLLQLGAQLSKHQRSVEGA